MSSSSAFTVTGSSGSGGSLVFLTSSTASSSAEIDFNGIFSAAYNQYLVLFSNLVMSTQTNFYMQVGTGPTPTWVTAGSYYYTTGNGGGGLTPVTDGAATAFRPVYDTSVNISASGNVNGHMIISGANATSNIFSYISEISYVNGSNNTGAAMCLGSGYIGAATYTSFRVYPTAGSITSGKISVYGFANS